MTNERAPWSDALAVLICLLALLMLVCHAGFHLRLVYDEVLIDALILLDIAIKLRREGYDVFISNVWNWLDLGMVWSIVLYWVVRHAWGEADEFEPVLIQVRYSILSCRLYCEYHKRTRSYETLQQEEEPV
jgi:hypothetical protein